MKNFINRHVWIYLIWDDVKASGELSLWMSPDPNAAHLDTIETPHQYRLTRNDIRYNLYSEVALSEHTAITLAGTMYDGEFLIAPKLPKKPLRRKAR